LKLNILCDVIHKIFKVIMALESDLGYESWPKWKLALAIGAPVALGAAGVWLYRRRLSPSSVVTSKACESVVVEDTTQVHQACCFHIVVHVSVVGNVIISYYSRFSC